MIVHGESYVARARRPRQRFVLAMLTPWLMLWISCAPPEGDAGDGTTGAPTTAGSEASDDDGDESAPETYVIRGQIAALPKADDARSSLAIRHEAIDDFKGVGGEIWGMDSMTMPFDVSDDLPLDGFAVDDKVQFTLVIDWFGDPAQEVTSIEKLAPDTELEFRKAQPPEAETSEEESNHAEPTTGS